MGLIESIFLAVGGVIAAAASRLIADDVKAWLPKLIDRIIDRAVKRLPCEHRERFAEEWRSHIADTPGDLGKLIVAMGLSLAAKRIAFHSSVLTKLVNRIGAVVTIFILAPHFVFISLLNIMYKRKIFETREYVRHDEKRIQCVIFNTSFTAKNGDNDALIQVMDRIMIRTGLTELPILLNVLRGEIAFSEIRHTVRALRKPPAIRTPRT
jgi:hypothetical protein